MTFSETLPAENPKGEMLFFIQISSVLSDTDYRLQGLWDELERAGATSPGDLQMPTGGLSATPLRGRVPAHWTVPVEGTGVGADAQQPAPD